MIDPTYCIVALILIFLACLGMGCTIRESFQNTVLVALGCIILYAAAIMATAL